MEQEHELSVSLKEPIKQFESARADNLKMKRRWYSRSTYTGALLFNSFTFLLPAMYGTLSKLWVANIDSSLVATTDVYTYIGVVAEVINEGLPRASYVLIGDRLRPTKFHLAVSHTLILSQMIAGLIMSIIFLSAASFFAKAFTPEEIREASIQYVRISSFSVFFSAIDVSVSVATRCLDRPDVPLIINGCKVTLNIILDLIFISTVRANGIKPTVNTQATIRLACDAAGAVTGLLYFALVVTRKIKNQTGTETRFINISKKAFLILVRTGAWTFFESAIRNALYLWLVAGIVKMGTDYATAWGVFNTIRWGLVMVPVSALEATSSTFVGHEWGVFSRNVKRSSPDLKQLFRVARPALTSAAIALGIEVILCPLLSFSLAKPYAMWLSRSEDVAVITALMWRTIDWCYIAYAINAQLATILLASKPKFYLLNSVIVNVFWVLPWAIAVTKIEITESNAWRYHSLIFGGSLVASFIVTLIVLAIWTKLILSQSGRKIINETQTSSDEYLDDDRNDD